MIDRDEQRGSAIRNTPHPTVPRSIGEKEFPIPRYDASVTPVWRRQGSFGYVEGGIGVYLLSATINNETNRLPSALQFGSHLGAGLSFEKASVGLELQHISNAGIKQPNGGINFYLLSVQMPL